MECKKNKDRNICFNTKKLLKDLGDFKKHHTNIKNKILLKSIRNKLERLKL